MKVFLSYSVMEEERTLIFFLGKKFGETGVRTDSVTGPYSKDSSLVSLNGSYMFVGLATQNGRHHEQLQREFNRALEMNIASILLVEKGAVLPDIDTDLDFVITFDRENPQPVIDKVNELVEKYENGDAKLAYKFAYDIGGQAIINLISKMSKYKVQMA